MRLGDLRPIQLAIEWTTKAVPPGCKSLDTKLTAHPHPVQSLKTLMIYPFFLLLQVSMLN